MSPGWTDQRRLIDPGEGTFRFPQKALSESGDALVVPRRGFRHFCRRGEKDLNHDELTIERELRLAPRPS